MSLIRTDKQAMLDWEEFRHQLKNSTTVDSSETEEGKKLRMAHLEKPGNEELWFRYYFPKYYFSDAAAFQVASSKRFINADKIYQRRAWARGLSKSTRRMFEVLYKMLVKKFPTNALLLSKNYENAERLLEPYRVNFDSNLRLINDYGIQEKPGSWAAGEFTTRSGAAFRAVGAGQNPRGARLEELRVTLIIADDLDDDEVCRNPDRLEQLWKWFEQAVIPTVDISRPYCIAIDNNIIDEDSIAVRAANYATDVETINIRDEFGNSTWPQKNSDKDIADIEASISYESFQQEYMNNPMRNGKAFPEMKWGKCPSIESLPFVVVYADPATSSKDRPSVKSKAGNSTKAVFIMGYKDAKIYVYYGFLDHITNSKFIGWLYACDEYINNKTQAYFYIENNTLQDPFYQEVFKPMIQTIGKERGGKILGITPDDTKKSDKWFRIEGTLEPINRNGNLVLNIDEKDNPHMKRLETQFKKASPHSKLMDGPDCIQGGVAIIQKKIAVINAGGIRMIKRKPNAKRY